MRTPTPRGATRCGDCDRMWTGTAQAHCARCHRHFSSSSGFDLHLTSDGCREPWLVVRKCQAPRFKVVEHKYGPTWVQSVHEPPCTYCEAA
jgi:hypothetical protein